MDFPDYNLHMIDLFVLFIADTATRNEAKLKVLLQLHFHRRSGIFTATTTKGMEENCEKKVCRLCNSYVYFS